MTTLEYTKHVRTQVTRGYWVRTRADEPLRTIRDGCSIERRKLALSSGAQIVSTDFPTYGMSACWGCDYAATLPGHRAVRCNPAMLLPVCRDDVLERLHVES